MKTPLFLAIAIVFIANVSSYGQFDFRAGYIIELNGDSIPGLVAFQTSKRGNESCTFKKVKKDKIQHYSPGEIAAYGFLDNKRFESKEILTDSSRDVAFLECLVKGSCNLYRDVKTFYVEPADKIITLPSRTDKIVNTEMGIRSKKDSRYIGVLNYLLYDCGLTADNTRYEERDLVNLIQNYNRCKGAQGIIYKSKNPWTKTDFSVFSGLNITVLHVAGFSANVFDKSYSPIIGASLGLVSPRLNEKFSFNLSAIFQKNKIKGFEEIVNNSKSIDRNSYELDISYLKIPIGFGYSFLQDIKTPYIKGGFVKFFKLKSSVEIIREHERSGTVDTEVTESVYNEASQYGFWIGAGYSQIINERYKGFIELRYERTNGFSGLYATSFSTYINVLVGVRF
jgi:hypothetical protein